MRRLLLAAGVGYGVWAGGAAPAQNGPAVMPGQVVGTTFSLSPVGSPAAPKVGAPVGGKPGGGAGGLMSRPYDPYRPLDVFKGPDGKGTGLDPKAVVATVSPFSSTNPQPDLIDKLYEKLNRVTRFFHPVPEVPPPTYTPGISRRNRERAEARMWRRD